MLDSDPFANTLLVENTGDRDNRWIAENFADEAFYVTNNKLEVVGSSELFLTFKPDPDPTTNQVIVTNLVEKDPGYTIIPQKDYSLKFEKYYGAGTIDSILSRGASLRVNVKAKNFVGEDDEWSNILIPEGATPGISDVITLSEGSKGDLVTVQDLLGLNPSTAGVGDPVIMSDLDGNPAEYQLVTNEITNVSGPTLQGQYLQRSLPRPPGKSLGTRYAPLYDWNDPDMRDHNSGNLVNVGDNPGDPSSGCVFLVHFPGGKSACEVIYSYVSNPPFWSDFWGSDDGSTWTHIETTPPSTAGTNPTIIASSHGLAFKYFAFARSYSTTFFPDDKDLDEMYGFNSSSSYRVDTYKGPEKTLTFESPNPDLKYFQPGDVLQQGQYERDFLSETGGQWFIGTWEDVLDGNDATAASWKISGGTERPTLKLKSIVPGSVVTVKCQVKQNNPGISINGRNVPLTNDDVIREVDIDVTAEGGFVDFEITGGGNGTGDTIKFWHIKVDPGTSFNKIQLQLKSFPLISPTTRWLWSGGNWLTQSSGDWDNPDYIDVPATGSNWFSSSRVWANLWNGYGDGDSNKYQCSPSAGNRFNADFTKGGTQPGIPVTGEFFIGMSVIKSGECSINGEDVANNSNWSKVTATYPDGGSSPAYKRVAGMTHLNTIMGYRSSGSSGFQSYGFFDDNGWLVSDSLVEGDKQVTYGPVTGEGVITNIDEPTNTYTISPNNGRFIDWTNSDSGNDFTHSDSDPSPQQFAVRLETMPFLSANNDVHVTLFDNLVANIDNYKLNYIAPPEQLFFDTKTNTVINNNTAYRQYGLAQPDNVTLFEFVNNHPSYAVSDYVRHKNTYYAVHDLTDTLQAIRDKINELQNP